MLGGVVVGGFVEDFGGFGKDKETVGETDGHPELFFVFGAEAFSNPLAEAGGALADVYGDVEDFALDDADEFALGLLDLVVEAPEDVLGRAGVIVLDEAGFNVELVLEVFLVEALEEKAAIVTEDFGL